MRNCRRRHIKNNNILMRMNDPVVFGIGLSIIPLGILVSENVCAYKFVRDVAACGIPKSLNEPQQETKEQKTSYLNRASSDFISSVGYNFARRIYQI